MNGLYSPDGLIQKDQLWTKYGYLVRYEALKMQSKLSSSVDIDDLIQAGVIALLDAIEQFDPKKGVKLTVYIAQRLRWAFMDELREHDWVPRRVRRKTREVSSAIMRVEQRAGGVASESDVAAELGMSLQEYQQVLSDTNTSMLCSLDELQELLADGVELPEMEQDHLDPLNDVLLGDLTKQISKEIRELPEREQMLLNLYYQQELNMKEVGSLLGITETRVSQLHSQTIKRLRARLEGRGWE
ncbi:RNA polymerase sigma factor FliA [Kosakonia sacchari]|uniref:RNA polymerase sigma factor FliA n=1 Tax=Kosakonia sacchari TaxID=1158459 RepID=UPI001362B36D|nr:RNA polymerase sigma factor FliA [Kosakonia sacchari]QHM93752.1 RNA polymerase sigma factor FliA [Kosakonia sacchari]